MLSRLSFALARRAVQGGRDAPGPPRGNPAGGPPRRGGPGRDAPPPTVGKVDAVAWMSCSSRSPSRCCAGTAALRVARIAARGDRAAVRAAPCWAVCWGWCRRCASAGRSTPESLRLAWDASHGAFSRRAGRPRAPSSSCRCWACRPWRPSTAATTCSPTAARNRSAAPGSSSTCSSPAWCMVVVARTALLFLMAWEVMSLSAYFLVTFEHEKAEVRRAGWVYLIATHLGVAFLFLAFVLLGRQAGSLEFEAFRAHAGPGRRLVGADLRARPDRLRGQGGLRSVPRLAARSAPGRSVARLRPDVGRDDQDGPLRAAARPDLPRASPLPGGG